LLLRCLLAFLGTRTLGGFFGQRTGNEPTGKAATLVLKGDGATGLPAALFFEPGEHVEGLAWPIEQRNLVDGQTHHHLGSRLQEVGQLLAATIAAVSHHQIAGLQDKEREALGGVAVTDFDIEQAACQQIIAQMHAPIVATAPGSLRRVASMSTTRFIATGTGRVGMARHWISSHNRKLRALRNCFCQAT